MNNNGLTNTDIKTFNDLLLKSNDYQLVYLLSAVEAEKRKRINNLKAFYNEKL